MMRTAEHPSAPATKDVSPGRRPLGATIKAKAGTPSQRRQTLQGILFVAPMVALVAVFVVVPLVRVIQLSFTAWDGIGAPQPVGLANFRYLYNWSSFRTVLVNNAILLSGLVLWVLLPFLLATVIYRLRRAALVRTIIFIPTILPPIVIGEVFAIMLSYSGPLNIVLRHLGLGVIALNWLTTPYLVLLSVIWVISWATFGVGVQFFCRGAGGHPVLMRRSGADRRCTVGPDGVERLSTASQVRDAVLVPRPHHLHGDVFLPLDLRPDAGGPRLREYDA